MASLEMNIRQASADFKAIKDSITASGVEVANGTKTADYAEKVTEVYEAGKEVINNQVEMANAELEEILYGADTGGKSFYEAFWNNYQSSGLQTNCDFMFAGQGWTTKNIAPTHDVKPKRANNMFSLCAFAGDLAQHFEDLGVALDFSECTMAQGMFSNAFSITRLGILDFRKVTYGGSWFINMNGLITIDKLLISENTISAGAGAFEACSKLVNLTIEGVINKNGYNLKWSTKLSKASIESIFNALSTTTSGLTLTLSKAAKEAAFTTDEWEALIATRKNWTISLV